jgi:hypothetical protein
MDENNYEKFLEEAKIERELLGEGLIWTTPPDKAVGYIHGHLSWEGRGGEASVTNKGKILIKFPSRKHYHHNDPKRFIDVEAIDKIIAFLNNMGYFPSQFNLYSNDDNPEVFNMEKLKESMLKIPGDLTKILFDPKFPVPVDPKQIPVILYHLTDESHEEKILKNGLSPKTAKKIEAHPDRVYLCKTKQCVIALIHNKKFVRPTTHENIILYEIDTTELKHSIEFFEDPSHEGAFFVQKNIHPKYIKENQRFLKNKINPSITTNKYPKKKS